MRLDKYEKILSKNPFGYMCTCCAAAYRRNRRRENPNAINREKTDGITSKKKKCYRTKNRSVCVCVWQE